MQTIADGCLDFSDKCIPAYARKIQKREMRRAFHMGCAFMFSKFCDDISKLNEAEAIKEIEKLAVELKTFQGKLVQGVA